MTHSGTGTAHFVKQCNGTGECNGTCEGRVYRLDPPYETRDWDDNPTGSTEFVWVSATIAMFSGPETYIFASDADGKVSNWGELPGSFQGGLDHEAALRGMGYEVASA